MKFYFDNEDRLNLDFIPQIKGIRPFSQLKHYYNVGQADFIVDSEYRERGVYLIEVSKLTHQWTAKNQFSESFNIFDNLPFHVIQAIQNKQLRLVIISIVEGDCFVKEFWDGFRYLTQDVKRLNFPLNSVCVVSANLKVDQEYQEWCKKNNELPIIEFIGAVEGPPDVEPIDYICAARVDINKCKIFNSLNRAHRQSRTEHLYFLAKNNLLDKGLVSGGMFFKEQKIQDPIFNDVVENEYFSILNDNYPKFIDTTEIESKFASLANSTNLNIYTNSMLTVVTETYFHEPGLYFSEKIFKPICVGSPQIVLGQSGYIQYFKSNFDIDLEFNGIDTSFDNIIDSKRRFNYFHKALLDWTDLSQDQKEKLFNSWLDKLIANQKQVQKINFKKIIVDKIVNSSLEYWKHL